MKKKILFFCTHFFFLIIGFGLGVYLLPILTAPKSIKISEINKLENKAKFITEFKKELKGSDLLHWGKAKVTISNEKITVNGSVSPGPDYKLYLTNEFVEDENEFLKIKKDAKYVSEVKSFKNFVIKVPLSVNVNKYNTVVIWCESFNEFITAAQYK